MIILDIETSGTDPKRHSMLSLGAVDYDTGEEFYGECSLSRPCEVDPKALEINGFKREDINPGKKDAPVDLYQDFYKWVRSSRTRYTGRDVLLAGHNIGGFDIQFLKEIHNAYYKHTPWIFGYRTLDLHSVAFAVFRESLSHSAICERLGLPVEPKPHNALSGAKSERDAFKALFARLEKPYKLINSAVGGIEYLAHIAPIADEVRKGWIEWNQEGINVLWEAGMRESQTPEPITHADIHNALVANEIHIAAGKDPYIPGTGGEKTLVTDFAHKKPIFTGTLEGAISTFTPKLCPTCCAHIIRAGLAEPGELCKGCHTGELFQQEG